MTNIHSHSIFKTVKATVCKVPKGHTLDTKSQLFTMLSQRINSLIEQGHRVAIATNSKRVAENIYDMIPHDDTVIVTGDNAYHYMD